MDKKSTVGAIIGLAVTPIVILMALNSGGAGHGNYFWAWFFFPLLTFIMLAGAGALVVPFVLLQYPFYGWYVGRCISKKQFARLSIVLLFAQAIPMLLTLL